MLDVMVRNTTKEEALAWAKDRVGRLLDFLETPSIAKFEYNLSCNETCGRLDELAASDTSWVPAARKLADLRFVEMKRAALKALAPDACAVSTAGPYISEVRRVLSMAAQDPVTFDALRFHAANLRDRRVPLCYELEQFVNEILRYTFPRPKPPGRRSVSRVRDEQLHAILYDIVQMFGVKPTSNRGNDETWGACDILAEAIPPGIGLPTSVSKLERIWAEGERAWKREFPESVS